MDPVSLPGRGRVTEFGRSISSRRGPILTCVNSGDAERTSATGLLEQSGALSRNLAVTTLAVATLLVASPGYGQNITSTVPPPPVPGPGPFNASDLALNAAAAATPSTVSLNVASVYDTNAAQSSSVIAAQRGLVLAEGIITPSAAIDYTRPVGLQTVFVQGSAGYDFHTRNTALNRERINIAGGANLYFGSCELAPTLGYSRQQTNLEDLSQNLTDNTSSSQSYQLTASCVKSTGFTPNLTMSEVLGRNSVNTGSNINASTISGGLNYNNPVLGQAGLFGEYQVVSYPDRIPIPGEAGESSGYDLESAGVTFVRMVGARLSLSVRVGYSVLDPENQFTPGFSGPTYSGQANLSLPARVSVTIAGQRAIQPTNFPGVSYTTDDSESISIQYLVGLRGSLAIAASTNTRQADGVDSNLDVLSFPTNERRNFISGVINYRLTRILNLSVNSQYERRIAQPGTFNFSGERVGLTLSAIF